MKVAGLPKSVPIRLKIYKTPIKWRFGSPLFTKSFFPQCLDFVMLSAALAILFNFYEIECTRYHETLTLFQFLLLPQAIKHLENFYT